MVETSRDMTELVVAVVFSPFGCHVGIQISVRTVISNQPSNYNKANEYNLKSASQAQPRIRYEPHEQDSGSDIVYPYYTGRPTAYLPQESSTTESNIFA